MEKNNSILTKPWLVAILAMFCCALWGSATPFIKIGYEIAMPGRDLMPTFEKIVSTILFAGVRFTLAGVLTVLIYSVGRKKFLLPQKRNWDKVLKISAFQTVLQYFFFYIGLSYTTGVKGTVITGGCNVFFSILIASLLFRQEKLTFKKIFACIIGFAGVILINLKGLEFNFNFFGDGFALISSICYAMSSSLVKIYSKDEDPVILSGWQFIIGGAVMVVVALLLGGHIDLSSIKAIGVLLYLSALSAVAYSLWGVLLKHNPVSKVSVYSFMTPVFGVLLSVLLLSEPSSATPLQLIVTLILICTGILIVNYKKD